MKRFIFAIFFSVFITFAGYSSADNVEVFNQIRSEVSELETLLKIVSDNEIDVGYGYAIPLPSATRSAMITEMLSLRASIRANLLLLEVE